MEHIIRNVNRRGEWRSRYATDEGNDMVDWAISLDGEEGWIKLSQKVTTPPPAVGQAISGRVEDALTKNGESYKRFKKENPNFSGSRSGQGDSNRIEQRLEYAISLLEELAGVKPVRDVAQESQPSVNPLYEDPFPEV